MVQRHCSALRDDAEKQVLDEQLSLRQMEWEDYERYHARPQDQVSQIDATD
jgi:hypothetical protein